MRRRQDDVIHLDLIFSVDVHMELNPLPIHMRPSEPDPRCVDVIHGRPHARIQSSSEGL